MAPAQNTLRLLSDPALPGPVNMGRDEALLEGVGNGTSPPTLRFYTWNPPTVSLGYFQPIVQFRELPPPAGALAIVRRPTGGGAILHDQELTYSIALPLDHPLLACGPNCLYDRMHKALIDALATDDLSVKLCGTSDDSGAGKGPFFCFARRHKYDVLFGSEKLAGSAQRRTRQAVLQHGSIILANRFEQQPVAEMNSIVRLSSRELADRIGDQLANEHKLTMQQGEWSQDELMQAEQFQDKHASKEWIERV